MQLAGSVVGLSLSNSAMCENGSLAPGLRNIISMVLLTQVS